MRPQHGALVGLGQLDRAVADALGEAGGEGLEVFPERARPAQVILHDLGVVEAAQRAGQAQTVEAVENADDIGLMSLYK